MGYNDEQCDCLGVSEHVVYPQSDCIQIGEWWWTIGILGHIEAPYFQMKPIGEGFGWKIPCAPVPCGSSCLFLFSFWQGYVCSWSINGCVPSIIIYYLYSVPLFLLFFFVCQILQPSVQQLNRCSLQWQVASTRCLCHRRNTVKSCREGLKSTAAFNLVPYGVISWHTACHTVSINIQKLADDVDDLITFDQHPQFCILHTCGVRFPCDSIGRP